MRKVAESEFHKYISLAGANTANRVYPLSIAEGYQQGEIYVDDSMGIQSAFFWHFCGFGYLSGEVKEEFLDEIYRTMTSDQNDRRLVLITNDERTIRFFRDRNVQMDSRIEYAYQPEGNRPDLPDPQGFRIACIDGNNLPEIKGRIIPSFSWENGERFLERGFGYLAVRKGEICAVAFSAAVSSNEIDIGVETAEAYRRNGLAAALAGRMCEQIIRLGKKPVWAHAMSNTGSGNTARKCGFVPQRVNAVIRKNV